MSQYALHLALPPVFTADNFFVSACNEDAWRWTQSWPNWQALLLYGPAGCGKSHLGHIWAARAEATIIPAAGLGTPEKGNWLVEDIEHAPERPLLHWINYVREQGGSLLMTSRVPTQGLPFTLPDLTSRLSALSCAPIAQPDDAVLAGAMRKQFSDRQMKVGDDVIAYALPRMERSLTSVRELVELLDARALAEGKNITVPFVKKVMEAEE